MKKFLLKVLLFFACVVIMDLAFGQFFSFLRTHAKGGSTANCEYIANRATDDIVILGSSRATHHYVPQIIEDSLGMSCYNCGEEGNGVVLAYGRLKMLTNRYNPKLVIYECTPSYDFQLAEPNNKYLGYLRPYYNIKGVKEIFNDCDDDFSWLKMKSKMYQNTGKILPDLVDNMIYRDNQKGFAPLYGKIDINRPITVDNKSLQLDSLKICYLNRIIDETKMKDIKIIFITSPGFGGIESKDEYEPIISLCKKRGVPFYDFKDLAQISENAQYFQDPGHMNKDGAVVFTKMLIKDVICKYIIN